MKTWSVEHEANSWEDDLYNGTFEECIEYCEKHRFKINGKECRLAQIEVEKDTGYVLQTHQYYIEEG